MPKEIRVTEPVDGELVFRCQTTGAYLKSAVVAGNKAYISILAALIYLYAKASGLKKHSESTNEQVTESVRSDLAAVLEPEDEEAKAALGEALKAYDGLLQETDIESLLAKNDPSIALSAKYLKAASSFNAQSSEESDKPKKPSSYVYVFSSAEKVPRRVSILDKPVFIPAIIPRGAVNGGLMTVEQDNKSINVQVFYDNSSSQDVPRAYADYFEEAPEYSSINAQGIVYVQSSTLIKRIVDNEIAAQRKKEQEEHEKKKAEAKASKAEEKKRKSGDEPAKEKPAKGRKIAKASNEVPVSN
jgi:hypothetical protein